MTLRNTIGSARLKGRAFSMVELMVAVLLLSISVAAMTRMWSISRNVTGKSQSIGETYSVARQEIERDKGLGFNVMFGSTTVLSLPRVTDYDQTGSPIATNLTNALSLTVLSTLTLTSPPTVIPSSRANASSRQTYYRAYSTYSTVYTGGETDAASSLGIETVKIWRANGTTIDTSGAPDYTTSGFYSTAGI